MPQTPRAVHAEFLPDQDSLLMTVAGASGSSRCVESNVETKMHDITILDHVIPPLQALLAGFSNTLFT